MLRLPCNGAVNILQLWASGYRTRKPILMKFGKQQQVRTTMTVTWSNMNFFLFKMTDDRHVGNIQNAVTRLPTVTQLGWSIDMSAMMRLPWQRPFNGIEHSAVKGVWRLNAWTSFDEIWYTMTVTWSNIKIFTIQNCCLVGKYWKYHNSPCNGPIGRNFAGRIPSRFRHLRHNAVAMAGYCLATAHATAGARNDALDIQQLWASAAERVNQFSWNLVYNSKFGQQWQSRNQTLNFLKFKMADVAGKYSKCHNSPTNGPTGTQLGWWHPVMFPILEML